MLRSRRETEWGKGMRILILGNGLGLSEQQVFTSLQQAGVDLHFMLNPELPAFGAMLERGFPVTQLTPRGRIDFKAVRRIREQIHQVRPHILHGFINRPLANGLLAAWGLDVRRVAYRGTVGHLSRFDPASWLTYLYPRLDSIVCVSEAVKQYLLRLGLPKERLVTLHKGHDPEWYRAQPVDRADIGLPRSAFAVSCAANFRPVKGAEYLIQSLDHLPQDHPVHLVLIGTIRDEKLFRHAARLRDPSRVHFLGYRTDAPAVQGACDVTAMCSVKREGLPKAVIEAMAQGKPALVTKVGGMPELVEEGCSGRVVPPRDPAALASAIRAFYEHPETTRRMGEAAFARIQDHFHVTKTAQRFLEIYRGLLEKRSDKTVLPGEKIPSSQSA